jgi:formylglycine-generating enzyme required for sulfatase activity
MGSDDGPASSRPPHQVLLDSFLIDRTEVTHAALAEYAADTGLAPAAWQPGPIPAEPTSPAAGILWREALAFCRWRNARLPTEAEWEKAARGDDARRYPWGMSWDRRLANSAETQSGGPLPVGTRPQGASPFGTVDMAGNVAEWVADFFDPAYYSVAPLENPLGPARILDHGLRGGSWASTRDEVTSFFRDSSHSVLPNPRVGFRCARSAPDDGRIGG